MRTGKLSTLLSAVLLGLPSSCRNDYEKLAKIVNEMTGFYPAKWMKWGIYLSMITVGILYSEKIQMLLTGVEPLIFGLDAVSPEAHLWWQFN